jgi:hypothetical protein
VEGGAVVGCGGAVVAAPGADEVEAAVVVVDGRPCAEVATGAGEVAVPVVVGVDATVEPVMAPAVGAVAWLPDATTEEAAESPTGSVEPTVLLVSVLLVSAVVESDPPEVADVGAWRVADGLTRRTGGTPTASFGEASGPTSVIATSCEVNRAEPSPGAPAPEQLAVSTASAPRATEQRNRAENHGRARSGR